MTKFLAMLAALFVTLSPLAVAVPAAGVAAAVSASAVAAISASQAHAAEGQTATATSTDTAVQPADEVIQEPTDADVSKLLDSIGNLKGASALAIAAFITQLLAFFLKKKTGELAGKYRYLAITVCQIVSGVVGLRLAGVDLLAALLHSSTLALVIVGVNQGIRVFKKAPAAE